MERTIWSRPYFRLTEMILTSRKRRTAAGKKENADCAPKAGAVKARGARDETISAACGSVRGRVVPAAPG